MTRQRAPLAVHAACAAAVVAAMAWVTADVLAFERADAASRAEAAHQETMRLALWRMDSWLGPKLATEATLDRVSESSIVRADYLIPAFGERTLRRGTDDESARAACDAVASSENRARLEAAQRLAMSQAAPPGDADVEPHDDSQTDATPAQTLYDSARQVFRNKREYWSRARSTTRNAEDRPQTESEPSPSLPRPVPVPPATLWVDLPGGGRELVLVRRYPMPLRIEDRSVAVLDWTALERALAEQVADLVPDVSFRALGDPLDAGSSFVLATIPVAIDASRPVATVPLVTPARTTLAVAWLAVAGAVVVAGAAVRRTTDLAERRRRFASSVTHELRTPLTTFRLYSEMLSEDMVTDPATRRAYLATLTAESGRLAHLVENVLAYARVEEGRMPLRRVEIGLGDLLLRATPLLDRRATDAGASLVVRTGSAAAARVLADPEVVTQILFNVVDNACKYAAHAIDRSIEIDAWTTAGFAAISVRDHGPGLPAGRAGAAFEPFDRAGRTAADAIPGIGLGLALSRALARDHGGDLVHEDAPGGGARFVVSVPLAPVAER